MHELLALFSSQQTVLISIEIVAILDLLLIRLIAIEISRRNSRKRPPILSEEEDEDRGNSSILSFVKNASIAGMIIIAALLFSHLLTLFSR